MEEAGKPGGNRDEKKKSRAARFYYDTARLGSEIKYLVSRCGQRVQG